MTEPMDEDYLRIYAAGQQARTSTYNFVSCNYCEHQFHGLPCVPVGGQKCECESSVRHAA